MIIIASPTRCGTPPPQRGATKPTRVAAAAAAGVQPGKHAPGAWLADPTTARRTDSRQRLSPGPGRCLEPAALASGERDPLCDRARGLAGPSGAAGVRSCSWHRCDPGSRIPYPDADPPAPPRPAPRRRGAQPVPGCPPAAGDVLFTHANISLAAAQLGYAPATPLREGLAQFVSWFREYYKDGANAADLEHVPMHRME